MSHLTITSWFDPIRVHSTALCYLIRLYCLQGLEVEELDLEYLYILQPEQKHQFLIFLLITYRIELRPSRKALLSARLVSLTMIHISGCSVNS